jgi:pimeloyl-ACP methyl ester carboxylesterase
MALPLGPEQIREQLYQFWSTQIGTPVVIVGASLGGTCALDFAHHHPEVHMLSFLVTCATFCHDMTCPHSQCCTCVLGMCAVLSLARSLARSCLRYMRTCAVMQAVSSVVLICAQAYVDGIGPAANAPTFFTSLAVKMLQSYPLRRVATSMGFSNRAAFATNDTVLIGRLHTLADGWLEGKLAFIKSGGYRGIQEKVS